MRSDYKLYIGPTAEFVGGYECGCVVIKSRESDTNVWLYMQGDGLAQLEHLRDECQRQIDVIQAKCDAEQLGIHIGAALVAQVPSRDVPFMDELSPADVTKIKDSGKPMLFIRYVSAFNSYYLSAIEDLTARAGDCELKNNYLGCNGSLQPTGPAYFQNAPMARVAGWAAGFEVSDREPEAV